MNSTAAAQIKTRRSSARVAAKPSHSPARKLMDQALNECDVLIAPISGAELLSLAAGWLAIAARGAVAAAGVLVAAASLTHLTSLPTHTDGTTVGNTWYGQEQPPRWAFVVLLLFGLAGTLAALLNSTTVRVAYGLVVSVTVFALLSTA